MRLREKVYEAYRAHIEEHTPENRQGALAMQEFLYHSPLYNGERVISLPMQIPHVFDEEDRERFSWIARTAHSICCKMIARYLEDPAYRRLFPYDQRTEELILSPAGYESLLPIARFDIFYHEDTGDFGFCEINTDGTSGMSENLWMDRAYLLNPAHQAVRRRYDLSSPDLFDPWVETFLRLYDSWEDPRELPAHRLNVAVVDFLGRGVGREFEEFARRFQAAGVDSQVVDPRDLIYRDGLLYSPEGHRIDALYRRAVTVDVLGDYDQVPDFLAAVKEGRVFMAGGFRTQVVHTKWIFLVMHLPETLTMLTHEEAEFIQTHIPRTVDLSPAGIPLDTILTHKDNYIIKPYDGYGSSGVVAGCMQTQDAWEETIQAAYGHGYICQDYYPQFASPNVEFTQDEASYGDGLFHPYINMIGLFTYDGELAGTYARQAADRIIASHHTERNQPTYWVR